MLTAFGRRLRADDGITLVELLVSMTVTTILGALTIIFFISAEHSGYKSVLTNQATADARNTLDSWTSLLRVAGWLDPTAKTDRFEEITPTKIVFYANLDNRNTADQTVGAPTKVALMLRTTDAATGEGQLIQVIFKPDNTTPDSVRQVAFEVTPTGGPGHAIFQPYTAAGGAIDVTTPGCLSGGTPQPGLCLQTLPANAGMVDPQIGPGSLAVSSGPLRGYPDAAVDVDSTLAGIGGITIDFTATDPMQSDPLEFTSSASVNSGFPA